LVSCSPWRQAQGFPNKPVKIVIGFPAGGPLDQHARLLSDRLQAVLGQPVLVDYKAGAGGTVGAQEVMKARPTATPSCWPTPA
jgi:tripartite-type tricarboxylate transporter receptor subunit TctC